MTVKYFPENSLQKHLEPWKMELVTTRRLRFRGKGYTSKNERLHSFGFQNGNSTRFLWQNISAFGLFRRHLVTCDVGVIDADYRGSVEVLLMNHHPHVYTVIIGQIVFIKKYDVIFEKVSEPALLGRTKRGSDGFGSTGSSGNKIFVSTVNDQVIVENASMPVTDKVIIDSDISNIDKIIIDNDLSESNDNDSEEID